MKESIFNTLNLQQLAHTMSEKIAADDFLQQSKEEVEHSVRILLESGLRQLNLVSREEFDAQCAVLARTRAQLDELSKQLNQLRNTQQ